MTYTKHIVAAAALLASFGVAHAEDSDSADRAAFYKSLQTPVAATAAPVIEGRQAVRIANPSETVQTRAATAADRYVEQHNANETH